MSDLVRVVALVSGLIGICHIKDEASLDSVRKSRRI